MKNLNTNIAFLIESKTPSIYDHKGQDTSNYDLNGVQALIKYDHIDKRWYVVPPRWYANKEEGAWEDPLNNPHRSWDDVKQDLLKKFSENYEL